MRILVTGSQGQLGRCIQDLATENSKDEYMFTDYQKLDITQEDKVNEFFAQIKFDYCINCAAYTAVDKAENEPDRVFEINAEGPRNLAKACSVNKCVLIHISTDFVFDGKKKVPYTENDIPNPINVYGSSKLKGEQYVKDVLTEYFIIRTSWVFSEYGHNFVKTMLRLGAEMNEISVVNDQIGSPTYAGDLAAVIMKIINLKTSNYGLYHYCNEGEISWFGFAKTIFEKSKTKIKLSPINSNAYHTQANRPKHSVIDKSKIKKMLNIQVPHWKDSLKIAIQNLNNHNLTW